MKENTSLSLKMTFSVVDFFLVGLQTYLKCTKISI